MEFPRFFRNILKVVPWLPDRICILVRYNARMMDDCIVAKLIRRGRLMLSLKDDLQRKNICKCRDHRKWISIFTLTRVLITIMDRIQCLPPPEKLSTYVGFHWKSNDTIPLLSFSTDKVKINYKICVFQSV